MRKIEKVRLLLEVRMMELRLRLRVVYMVALSVRRRSLQFQW